MHLTNSQMFVQFLQHRGEVSGIIRHGTLFAQPNHIEEAEQFPQEYFMN